MNSDFICVTVYLANCGGMKAEESTGRAPELKRVNQGGSVAMTPGCPYQVPPHDRSVFIQEARERAVDESLSHQPPPFPHGYHTSGDAWFLGEHQAFIGEHKA
jgi:hypothetical protein